MLEHGSKYFARRAPTPSPVLWMRSEGQNSTFSEHGHVTFQIKENQECTNMVANILLADPLTPLRPWGRGFRSNFF